MLRIARNAASIGVVMALGVIGSLVSATPVLAVAGGSPVATDTYRYVAKLEVGDVRSCSGALIDSRWVLTAATCFTGADGKRVERGAPAVPTTVTVGRAKLSDPESTVVGVAELVPHPDRNVVLAKLASPVAGVLPVSLALTPPIAGEVVRVAGFGRTKTEWVPDSLHTAKFKVQSVDADTMAVISAEPADASTCKGDSGGPALRENGGRAELVALNSTSWQNGCFGAAETRVGATEVRVDDLSVWIGQQILEVIPSSANPAGATLKAAHSDKCLNVPNGSSNANVALVQWQCVGNTNEQWYAESMGDGTYHVVSTHTTATKMCLNVPGADLDNSVAVVQYPCTATARNDRWRAKAVPGTNRFQLIAAHSNKCLNVPSSNKANGAAVIQYACTNVATTLNEQWYFPPAGVSKPTVPLTGYTPVSVLTTSPVLPSLATGATFAYTDNAGRVVLGHQQNLSGAPAFNWTVSAAADTFAGQPVLTKNSAGVVQVTAHSTDGDVWLRSKTAAEDGQSWGGWADSGGASPSHPTSVRLGNGTVVTFNVGPDGALWHAVQPDPYVPFLGWRRLGGGQFAGTPTVELLRDGSVQVFALNVTGAVQTANYRDGKLAAWSSLGGSGLNGTLAAVERFDDITQTARLFVFGRSADGRIMFKARSGNGAFAVQWSPVGSLAAAGSPSATVVGTKVKGGQRVIVAVRGTDGLIHTVREGDWAAWSVAVPGVQAKSDPTVFSHFPVATGTQERADLVFRVDEQHSYWAKQTADGYTGAMLPAAPQ